MTDQQLKPKRSTFCNCLNKFYPKTSKLRSFDNFQVASTYYKALPILATNQSKTSFYSMDVCGNLVKNHIFSNMWNSYYKFSFSVVPTIISLAFFFQFSNNRNNLEVYFI